MKHQSFTVLAALAFGCTSASMQTSSTTKSAAVIPPLLEKERPAIEKVLGSPTKKADINGLEACDYDLAGTKGIRIYYGATGNGQPYDSASQFDLSFEKGTSWTKAVAALGMKTEKLKVKMLENIPGMFEVIGHPHSKIWHLYYAAAGARYPGKGELINPNGGLTFLQFQGRCADE
jgi:hypothetical protein